MMAFARNLCRIFHAFYPFYLLMTTVLIILIKYYYFARDTFREPVPVYYARAPEAVYIDCGRVMKGDKVYVKAIAQNRTVSSNRTTDFSCDAVRERVLPSAAMEYMDFGIAQARIVYKDYMFIEEELRSSYHPQNRFCYTLDSKASSDFRNKMRQLPSCLPNVYVASEEFDINSIGRSMNRAHLACLKLLIKLPGWNYVMLLQNHDVIIKSVYEIAEIYHLFGGANDIELNRLPLEMYDNSMKWNAKSLKLFEEKTHVKHSQRKAQLHFAKGVVQASLSRAAVDWLVNKVNLTTIFRLFDQKPYFDEVLLPSLQISDDFGMPGGFSSECHKKGYAFAITRLTDWANRPKNVCRTGFVRHGICIAGLEHVAQLAQTPHITINKMMPDFDYGAIECVHEMVFNRTFLNQNDHPLNRSYYESLAQVVFHKHRKDSKWLESKNCSFVEPYKRATPRNIHRAIRWNTYKICSNKIR